MPSNPKYYTLTQEEITVLDNFFNELFNNPSNNKDRRILFGKILDSLNVAPEEGDQQITITGIDQQRVFEATLKYIRGGSLYKKRRPVESKSFEEELHDYYR